MVTFSLAPKIKHLQHSCRREYHWQRNILCFCDFPSSPSIQAISPFYLLAHALFASPFPRVSLYLSLPSSFFPFYHWGLVSVHVSTWLTLRAGHCLHWGVPYTVHLYKYRLNTITVRPLRPLRPEIAWESQARDLWSPESITFLQAGGTEALCVQRLQFSLRWCPLGSGPGVHDASTVYTRWGYCHCRLGIMR